LPSQQPLELQSKASWREFPRRTPSELLVFKKWTKGSVVERGWIGIGNWIMNGNQMSKIILRGDSDVRRDTFEGKQVGDLTTYAKKKLCCSNLFRVVATFSEFVRWQVSDTHKESRALLRPRLRFSCQEVLGVEDGRGLWAGWRPRLLSAAADDDDDRETITAGATISERSRRS
jgi:hypothetical protein